MKGNLLQGTARGKMGDIVAKVVHGKQVFSKYQPVVFNPKSQRQSTQRDIFTRAAIFSKGALLDNFVSNRYAVNRGASKSMTININRLAIFTARMKNSAQGCSSKIEEPLMYENINENRFNNDFFDNITGLGIYIKGIASGEEIYFGSISPLIGNLATFKAIYTDNTSDIGISASNNYWTLTNVAVTAPDNERNMGFQNSSDDCGNWPYIYKINVNSDGTISTHNPTALTVNTESCRLSHLIYSTDAGEVFGYDIANNIGATPTP